MKEFVLLYQGRDRDQRSHRRSLVYAAHPTPKIAVALAYPSTRFGSSIYINTAATQSGSPRSGIADGIPDANAFPFTASARFSSIVSVRVHHESLRLPVGALRRRLLAPSISLSKGTVVMSDIAAIDPGAERRRDDQKLTARTTRLKNEHRSSEWPSSGTQRKDSHAMESPERKE